MGQCILLKTQTSNNINNHSHSNKNVLDQITDAVLQRIEIAHQHISDQNNPHHVTAQQVGAMPIGPFTWGQMKAQYTWGQLKGV